MTEDDLKSTNSKLEQKIKLLQITAVISLAVSAGLGIGFAISMTGATTETTISSAVGTFFAVITVSIRILNYMRR